jgi:hypothetical protein
MYNVFKRPMFKLGGQADQGTGIMSTVEPKQTMRQNPYTGYAIGGRIGYANGPGPVLNFKESPFYVPGMNLMESNQAFNKYIEDRNKKLFEADTTSQDYYSRYPLQEKRPMDDREAILKTLQEKGKFSSIRGRPTRRQEDAAIEEERKIVGDVSPVTEKSTGSNEEDLAFATGIGGQKINTPPPPSPKKEPKYKETYNLKEQIAKESQEIKDLLKDEDYSKGELALILSAAIGKKGTIAEKIQEATRLALPLAQSRRKEDKDVTLAAYKLAKEKELYNIRFGAGTEGLKNLRAQAEAIARKENRDVDAVLDDLLIKSGESKIKDVAKAGRLEYLAKEQSKINSLANDIRILENQKAQLESTGKNTTEVDKRIAEARKEFSVFSSYPEFEEALPQYKGFKAGGRIMKQVGGDLDETEETENNDMIASKVSFDNKPQDATVVEKPVEKLSYQQLRDRLPQEITNDVVMLIANSEEALQDFAYIRTQNDVSKFNVKYGVNLVVPPTAS